METEDQLSITLFPHVTEGERFVYFETHDLVDPEDHGSAFRLTRLEAAELGTQLLEAADKGSD